MRTTRPWAERFWEKVNKTEGCWLWTAARQKRAGPPYGFFAPVHGTLRLAHRLSWELHHGPIPEGMHVLHHCDVPLCVNPAHLYLGTGDDNMADRAERHREARGSRHGLAKLTEDQVRRIRALYVPRKYPLRRLAREFNIDFTVVHQIVTRRTWTHVE